MKGGRYKSPRHMLKALQVREGDILVELEVLAGGVGNAQREADLRCELHSLQERIAHLQGSHGSRQPFVTEHALLRYLERVKGIDLEAIEREILTPERVAMIKSTISGNCALKVNGMKFVVLDSAVITVREG